MSKFEDNNLSETRKSLINEIEKLSYEEINRRTDDSNWSIAQICHHLVLSEETFAKAIEYGLNNPKGTSSEAKNIHYVLDRTTKWNAPDMVMPSFEPFENLQIIGLLSNSRNYLQSVLNSVEDRTTLNKRSVKHPVFGYLPLYQWIELVYLHEQRHIKQIRDVKTIL